MKMGKHYAEFVQQKTAEGYHPFVIANLPGAKAAFEKDKQAAFKADVARTKDGWLAHMRDAKGNLRGFANAEERSAAMRDPMYAQSAEYRAAVADIAAITPDEVMGYRSKESEQRRMGLDAESMEKQARHEWIVAEREKLFRDANSPDKAVAAKARYDIIRFSNSNDPAERALVGEAEQGTQFDGRFSLERELKEAKARGERVRAGDDLEAAMSNPNNGQDNLTSGPYEAAFAAENAPLGQGQDQ